MDSRVREDASVENSVPSDHVPRNGGVPVKVAFTTP